MRDVLRRPLIRVPLGGAQSFPRMSVSSRRISSDAPLVVYGTTASYYTGKLEAYLRAKGLAYHLVPFSDSVMRRCIAHTGVVQIPQVECPDGSWLVDSTLIMEHFEQVNPDPRVTPAEPAVAFISRMIEDYADEWLWRPAMHYRWSFPETARLMSAWLAEHLGESRLPQWLKRRYWRRRQFRTFVEGDGVNARTRAVVEACYLETLSTLESVFACRSYVLGERPTEADFGFCGTSSRIAFARLATPSPKRSEAVMASLPITTSPRSTVDSMCQGAVLPHPDGGTIMAETQTYKGGCFCGAVEVEVKGQPAAVGICHCESCRKWHSAPVNAWAVWPDAMVKVTAGQDHLLGFNKQGADGPSGRSSCKRCGGAVLNRKPKIGMTVVYAMTLDSSGLMFEPTFRCFYGEGVLHMADGLPKFDDLPAPLGGSGKQCDEPAGTGFRR